MNRINRLLTTIIIVFADTIPVYTILAKDWSDRVENNFTVDGTHWGLGGRLYMNYGTSHVILRYNFDGSWSSQYRYVTKNGGDVIEHWFRLQHKDIKLWAFFWNSRIEYRILESTNDVLRFRPQTGFKFNVLDMVKPYYIIEPHWEYDFSKSKGFFKGVQHFIGFDIVLNKNVSLGPFIEIDTDYNWQKQLVFLGTELQVIIE